MGEPAKRWLSKVVDYAGVFPPAKLAVTDAVENYLAAHHGPNRWIVDRFVINVGRLEDLIVELDQHTPEEINGRDPIGLTVVGTAQPDHKHWKSGFDHDVSVMERFQRLAENRAEVLGFEIRVPDHEHLEHYTHDLKGFSNLDIFVELPWGPMVPESIGLIAAMDSLNVKARTGGVEASAFPSAIDVAGFIQATVQSNVPFKCTAGLHEPVAHPDPVLQATHHGFVNIFAATAFAMEQELSRKELAQVLEVQDPAAFVVTDEGLRVGEFAASSDALQEARELFLGFGCCSIQEPVEGLRRMGWLS
ncbi:MAG: hypothetical protein JST35_12195 [Armatimonadetes bacterium]|nr:hypothetical protein [Armatimonadota bacterium]